MKSTTIFEQKRIQLFLAALLFASGIAVLPFIAYAAPTATSTLTQSITAGALSTDIRDVGGSVVSSPSFTMTSATVTNSQQTVTGTFGSNTQRITVDNPGGANNGWTLAWNSSTPGSSTWTSGGNSYAYNGSASAGQLTVNPASGTLTAVTGGSTGVSLGSSTAFSGSTPVSLITAASNSADIWNGYVTGIGLSQTIPASQPAGSYSIDMVQTVTAT